MGKVGKISNLLDHGMASIQIADASNDDLLWPISYLTNNLLLGEHPLEHPLVALQDRRYKQILGGHTCHVPNEVINAIFEFLFGFPGPVSDSRVLRDTVDTLVLVAGLTGKTTFEQGLVSCLFPGKYDGIDFGRRLVAVSEGSLSQNPDGSFRISLGTRIPQVRSFQGEFSSWRDYFRHIFSIMAISSKEYEMMCHVFDIVSAGGAHSYKECRFYLTRSEDDRRVCRTHGYRLCRRVIDRLKELGVLRPDSEMTYFGMRDRLFERAGRVAP